MESTSRLDREAVGAKFSLPAMQYARDKTFEGVQRIAAGIRPGMTEKQACDFARITLEAMGMQRIWHQIIVRFGRNTLKTFKERIDPDHVLGAHDIFFIDLGIVWDDHEGDAGDTFVVGEDPEMHACAEAARTLWQEVSARWREDGLGGPALYQYAAQRAEAAGWKLNLEIKGHRVSDFPHAIYRAGDLGDNELCPKTGLWILEIQIAHPTKPFGAFYEDILIAS
ncbi:M24 family metallopeptidase [Cupriavidus sp. YAF13]|uniref:M24 family metallopeptidase n=1 Tax=Cupriavidus sp. YAF13 TaxID=3233075 RepID=UPI003F92976E